MNAITKEVRNEAYRTIDNLPHQRQKVMEAIRLLDPCTEREVANHLGWTINRVSGRFHELANVHFLIKPIGATQKLEKHSKRHTLWTEITDEKERKIRYMEEVNRLHAELAVMEDDLKTGMSRVSLDILQKEVDRKQKLLDDMINKYQA